MVFMLSKKWSWAEILELGMLLSPFPAVCAGPSMSWGVISSSEKQVSRIPTSQSCREIQAEYHPQTTWHQTVVPIPIYTSSWEPLQGALLASAQRIYLEM